MTYPMLFIKSAIALSCCLLAGTAFASSSSPKPRNSRLYVGSYNEEGKPAIYAYEFDATAGKLKKIFTVDDIANPSFLTVNKDGTRLYAVSEQSTDKGGLVYAYKAENKALISLNKQPTYGDDPCYVSLSGDGKFAVVGNYSGGNFTIYPLKDDGSLGEALQTIEHQGSSINTERQEGPHVHSAVFNPENTHVFVADLGTDDVYIYQFDADSEQPLTPAKTPSVSVEPGAGPRHIIFSEDGQYAYLILELNGTVTVFNHAEGRLTPIETVQLTDSDFQGEQGAAEIRLSPDGKFLYASNRGDAHEISVFAIDAEGGTLSLVERISSGGEVPRNFEIDPSGNFLLVTHQDSNDLIVFKRDIDTGKLSKTEEKISLEKPVYLKFVE